MAVTYKELNTTNDITTTKTKIHEVLPLTGSIISGTYGVWPSGWNIKKYSHGMFESVYDYSYLSSSANHIFDITAGIYVSGAYGPTGARAAADSGANKTEKTNIYAQMAQVLVGHDITGAIRPFDRLGSLTGSAADKIDACIFMPISRLLMKDEIQKETFTMTVFTGSGASATEMASVGTGGSVVTIKDIGALTSYKNNSPAGEYSVLYTGSTAAADAACGLIYYQAGVVVLDLSSSAVSRPILNSASVANVASGQPFTSASNDALAFPNGAFSWSGSFSSCSIDNIADGFRTKIKSVSFNNTTEVNSTIYFCRMGHNEFNYSSNPTYVTGSKIRVKEVKGDSPVAYATTVGLYSADNVLMAVAKLSEPLKKTPKTDFTLRVRLDY
jgi:hypothetical protein